MTTIELLFNILVFTPRNIFGEGKQLYWCAQLCWVLVVKSDGQTPTIWHHLLHQFSLWTSIMGHTCENDSPHHVAKSGQIFGQPANKVYYFPPDFVKQDGKCLVSHQSRQTPFPSAGWCEAVAVPRKRVRDYYYTAMASSAPPPPSAILRRSNLLMALDDHCSSSKQNYFSTCVSRIYPDFHASLHHICSNTGRGVTDSVKAIKDPI